MYNFFLYMKKKLFNYKSYLKNILLQKKKKRILKYPDIFTFYYIKKKKYFRNK